MTNPDEQAIDRAPVSRKKGSKKTARFNLPPETSSGAGGSSINNDGECVEITLDVRDDSFMVSTVELAAGDHEKAPGRHTSGSSSSSKRSAALQSRKSGAGLKFTAKKGGRDASWAEVERQFDSLTAETYGLLHSSDFGKCLGMEEQSYDFGEALFYALARLFHLSGDTITKEDLKCFWDMIADQNFDSRLITFLDMVDKDSDGRITPDDLKEIIILSASANRLSIEQQADEYSALIMDKLDPDGFGYIRVEDLKKLLLESPELLEGSEEVVRGNNRQYTSHELSEMVKTSNSLYHRFNYFIADHWRRVWIITLWLVTCFALFIYKFVEYKNKDDPFAVMGYCVCVAKGGAETLKLNMALILLPVCRNTITWLRNKTKLDAVVPFDDNLNFHKVIAVGIIVGVMLHAGAHLTCDFPRILMASDQKYEEHLARYLGEAQPTSYWWFVKGWEGVTGILMIVLMAIAFPLATPWLRRNEFREKLEKLPERRKTATVLRTVAVLKAVTGFNAFWYTHHLFVIVYALLVIHGIKLYFTTDKWKKTTWMYIALPIALYASERLIRVFRSTIKPVKVLVAAHYPGNLLALKMSKPSGFQYKSGQYMFVNCPAVSRFEWHPFSITSAPGEDHLGVHIRALGDWTERIKHVFKSAEEKNLEYPEILIDAAYGAPAQEYKKYDIVMLIGLGIGATPMISIVKDIINNMKTIEEEDQYLENGTWRSPATRKKEEVFETKRAYFYWVTGQQGTFEWFKGVMNEVEEIDERKVIEMHNYCSSVYEESDARSAMIGMLQTLHYAKTGEDLVSTTRVKSIFAKPDWRKVYQGIAVRHPHKTVGVFYCGPAGAVKELKDLALDFSRRTPTKFEFHKENF